MLCKIWSTLQYLGYGVVDSAATFPPIRVQWVSDEIEEKIIHQSERNIYSVGGKIK